MLGALLALALGASSGSSAVVSEYLEAYFKTFPSKATEAGRHDFDEKLEDLTPLRRAAWLGFNRAMRARLLKSLSSTTLGEEDRLDAELLLRQAEREIHDFEVRRRPERDPLFWTNILGNATVFLLVRDDLPQEARLSSARARVRLLPRLALEARQAFAGGDPARVSPELTKIAAAQARATATFYREGFARLFAGKAGSEAAREGSRAADALERLARLLGELSQRATGTPRLSGEYAEAFRIATGVEEPVASVLVAAWADLEAKKREAALYGRQVWRQIFPTEEPPADGRLLLRRLFVRVAADRAQSTEEFVEDYRKLVQDLDAYLRANPIVTLPGPLTLSTDRSLAFFVGQSVGGVYAAGPYAPEAKTLWYLPTPPDSATSAEREAFFRDFNHHFNVMITPHEILPGHYLQLKFAARHPRKVRALFPDEVYVEGWGTFCERLMLDQGWGGPLDWLAHWKKQLENTARAVVDIRVHTEGISREEVLRYVRDDALQDEQFASNMWTRAITTPVQITTYWLGYRQVRDLYEQVRKSRGAAFRVQDFMDGMMELGPVAVRRYRERLLPRAREAP